MSVGIAKLDRIFYSINTEGKFLWLFGSSVFNRNIKVLSEANYKCNTVMFRGLIKIPKGSIEAQKVFFNDKSIIKFGDNFKITADVYVLSDKDFNSVLRAFTDESMNKFLSENNFQAVKANGTSLASLHNDLIENYNQHYNVENRNLLKEYEFSLLDMILQTDVLIGDAIFGE